MACAVSTCQIKIVQILVYSLNVSFRDNVPQYCGLWPFWPSNAEAVMDRWLWMKQVHRTPGCLSPLSLLVALQPWASPFSHPLMDVSWVWCLFARFWREKAEFSCLWIGRRDFMERETVELNKANELSGRDRWHLVWELREGAAFMPPSGRGCFMEEVVFHLDL